MGNTRTFVTFGEIQEYKKNYWKTHGVGCSFPTAFQSLEASGKLHHGSPEIPDFLSWDLESTEQFRKLVNRIPITIDEVLNVRQENLGDRITRLKVFHDVQICVESSYTDDHLYAIQYFTIIYVLHGSCTLHLLERNIEMKRGELCLLPPHIPYCVWTTPEDLVINISCDRELFDKQFSMLLFQDNPLSIFFRRSLFEDNTHFLLFMLQPTKDFKSIIQHLFHEYLRKDDYSHALFLNYLQILYTNIIRSIQKTRNYYINKERTLNTIFHVMPAILEYINENFHYLTLEDLAEQFHYDPAYLSREIKTHTGLNYKTLVTNLKLQEAFEMLTETDLPVSEIASHCGYNSVSHFGYAFKQKYGFPATAVRKETGDDSLSPE